jgi:hypothetical protein
MQAVAREMIKVTASNIDQEIVKPFTPKNSADILNLNHQTHEECTEDSRATT